ncbi:Integrase zinc binding domain [Popillia japonica]|uniref:RNA-directed DNA polymerase n=1 Tax=Popillia japonica TaxID=7064 RepID=A0AAW1LAX9_POPJA
MGGSTSKEEKEVIIAQAGNSGGTSGAVNQVSFEKEVIIAQAGNSGGNFFVVSFFMSTILENFKVLHDELKVFKNNITKDRQERRTNVELTQKKLVELEKFSTRLQELKIASISEKNLDVVSEIKLYVHTIYSLINETNKILASRLESNVNMESFSLKTAGSLLPCMDGDENTTKKLIDSITLYADLLKADDKKHLINFVLKTRISENAKIRLNKSYDSVDELIKDIRTNFVARKSATTISTQLHQIKQQNKTLSEFGQEIEQLLSDLTLAQADGNENLLNYLRPVNEKIAINSFSNGVRSQELRTILKSRNCESLKEAINTAIDEERNRPSPSNVFHFNRAWGNQRGYRGFTDNRNASNSSNSNQYFNTRGNYNNFRRAQASPASRSRVGNRGSRGNRDILASNSVIDKTEQVIINGIAGSTKAIGATNIPLSCQNNKIYHKFLVVNNINCDISGIIGIDFLSKHNAVIDFEQFSFSFWINTDKIILPLESKYNVYTVIPPRCEIIKYFWVDDVDDCVVLPNEIAQGVFIAGIIARPNLHTIPIRILNTNDKEIKIKNFKPTTAKLYNFESYTFDSNHITVNRVDNILDLINVTGLNKEERDSIHKICAKYADVFLLDNDPVTPESGNSQKAEIDRQIDKMLQEGIIEETRSNWSSPVLIVPKKSDSSGHKQWRIVIDYRLLNKSVEDDRFPLPNITEILDSLSGAFYFTHLDLSQGYYQVELDQNSRKYTAFTTSKGQFQMTRLPMGLKTSPSSFSRVMTIAMSGLNFESCFVYLDDLIVFGNNLQNHNQNLVKVFNRLRQISCSRKSKSITGGGRVNQSQEARSDETNERIGHPGIVELLKQPSNSVELRQLHTNNLITGKRRNKDVIKTGNILYDMKSQILFVKLSKRSVHALDAELSCLRNICIKYGIPQLCIFKCKENEENDFHLLPTGGHAGINRMYANIKRYYFWQSLKNDIYRFISKCDDCQRYKHSKLHLEPLSITTTASSAFETVYLDLVGPLNQDNDENKYILTIQCELSKFVDAYPIKDKEAQTVAKTFVNNFILKFGIPKRIVTDQGTEFLAKVFKESAKLLGMKQLMSTAYHHQTLGSLENTHKSLGAYIRIQIHKFPDTWSAWVPYWCFSFNNTVHTSTKYTPYELVFGKRCQLPSSIVNKTDPLYNFDNYANELKFIFGKRCQLPSSIVNKTDPLYNFDNYANELKFRLQTACNDARNNLIEKDVSYHRV